MSQPKRKRTKRPLSWEAQARAQAQADRKAQEQERAQARKERRAAQAALRRKERAQAALDLKRLRLSFPVSVRARGTKKKSEFNFKAIYSELGKYYKPEILPKLKNPARASKKTKNKLLDLFGDIQKRKNQGLAYYSVRGEKRRKKVARIFDPTDQDVYKGAWISKARAGNGEAKIKFDKKGNPVLKFGRSKEAPEGVFFELDLEKLSADPEAYIKKLLAHMPEGTLFFPVEAHGYELQRHGAGLNTIPTIWEILTRLMDNYSNHDKWLNGIVAYPKL